MTVCGAAVVIAKFTAASDHPATGTSAEAYLQSLADDGAPGCAAGVYDINSNRWILLDTFGLANLETGRAIKPDTIFGVASVTKQFTAAAAAIAAVEGQLSLDDDVRRYIPTMPEHAASMTIRDLINHTNGLRDIGRLTLLTGKPEYYTSKKARVALLLRQQALNFPPGEDYRYGNSGYLLLAEVIERATGESFADYVDRVIFTPLDMTDSYFGTATRGKTRRALPYSAAGDAWRNDDPFFSGDGEWGHQGLMTTLEDYAKWIANLYSGDSRLAGGTALTATLRSQGSTRDGSAVPYGFGLRFETYKGLATIGHSGSGLGYKAHTMIFSERKLAVLGFCNHGRYAQPMVMRLADIVLELDNNHETSASEAAEYTLSPEALVKFAGDYREPTLRLPMFVVPADGGLLVTGDVAPSHFKPVANHRFLNDQQLDITFELSREGHAETLIQGDRRKYGTGRFERIDRVIPSADDLERYTGDYYAEELGSTYRFAVEKGKLTLRIPGSNPGAAITLEPMLKDEFVSTGHRLAIRFQRQDNGHPMAVSLTYQFGWITDLLLQRVDD